MSDEDVYYQEMYEEYLQERAHDEWEEQMESDRAYEDQALQDTLDSAARENCYADYSSGKRPTMECEYSTGSPSKPMSQSEAIATLGFVFAVIVGIIAIVVFVSKRKN